LQWPSTNHKDNRYKCADWKLQIHASYMDSCMVACSQVGEPSDLFVYAPEGRTKNIVYPNTIQ